jgi:hypothetical protein
MLKQTERLTDPGSNPGCSTISTCCTQEYRGFESSQQVFMMGQICIITCTLDNVRIKTVSGTIRSQCASDGADIGLDADMIKKVELPLGEGRNPSNLK